VSRDQQVLWELDQQVLAAPLLAPQATLDGLAQPDRLVLPARCQDPREIKDRLVHLVSLVRLATPDLLVPQVTQARKVPQVSRATLVPQDQRVTLATQATRDPQAQLDRLVLWALVQLVPPAR